MGYKISIPKMKTRELKKELMSLHDLIYNIECFGTNDIFLYEVIAKELENRGIEIIESHHLILKQKNTGKKL